MIANGTMYLLKHSPVTSREAAVSAETSRTNGGTVLICTQRFTSLETSGRVLAFWRAARSTAIYALPVGRVEGTLDRGWNTRGFVHHYSCDWQSTAESG